MKNCEHYLFTTPNVDLFLTWLSGSVTFTALSGWSMSGLNLPFGLFMEVDNDLRDALELLRDSVPGARRLVAPRPARRLLCKIRWIQSNKSRFWPFTPIWTLTLYRSHKMQVYFPLLNCGFKVMSTFDAVSPRKRKKWLFFWVCKSLSISYSG
jgi:hypothetical protein